jgi:hypothetical protein
LAVAAFAPGDKRIPVPGGLHALHRLLEVSQTLTRVL